MFDLSNFQYFLVFPKKKIWFVFSQMFDFSSLKISKFLSGNLLRLVSKFFLGNVQFFFCITVIRCRTVLSNIWQYQSVLKSKYLLKASDGLGALHAVASVTFPHLSWEPAGAARRLAGRRQQRFHVWESSWAASRCFSMSAADSEQTDSVCSPGRRSFSAAAPSAATDEHRVKS